MCKKLLVFLGLVAVLGNQFMQTEADGSNPVGADADANAERVEWEQKLSSAISEEGADLNALNSDNMAAIHYAALLGDMKNLKFLRGKGASVDVINHFGNTPLHLAAQNGQKQAVGFLLKFGADINAKNNNGDTPLFTAIKYADNIDIFRYLCDNGAIVNIKDDDGHTLLHKAAMKGFKDIAEYVISKGLKVDEIALDGSTPRDLASEHNQKAMADYLLAEERKQSPKEN